MTTLIDHTLHCPCCGQTESIHGFTCRCTWQWCPRCYKCLVHCGCQPTQKNAANMLQYPYHYCHMTSGVVQLSYDNERELNDGRRTSPASQGTRMEPVQAHTARTGFLLCAQMEARAGVHHFGNEVARIDQRTGTEEDRGCVRVADIFSVTAHSTPITIGTRLDAERDKLSPHVHCSMLRNDWQRCNDLRVAGGGIL